MSEGKNVKNLFLETLIQTQLLSLRAEGEAIPFLGLLRSLSLPRNDNLLNASVLVERTLWKINQENIDIDYIKQWVDLLGIRDKFNRLVLI